MYHGMHDTDDDEECAEHCECCWQQGGGCCICGADPMPVDEALARGTDPEDDDASWGIA